MLDSSSFYMNLSYMAVNGNIHLSQKSDSVLNPEIWGKWYWGFLHTIAISYPSYPNAVTKKKYYELIQNFHIFFPIEHISTHFLKLIETYPVAPYLDTRETFIKWVHFIHNKINEKMEKPTISLHDFYIQYYQNYKQDTFNYKLREKVIYIIIIVILVIFIYYLYNK